MAALNVSTYTNTINQQQLTTLRYASASVGTYLVCGGWQGSSSNNNLMATYLQWAASGVTDQTVAVQRSTAIAGGGCYAACIMNITKSGATIYLRGYADSLQPNVTSYLYVIRLWT